MAVEEIPDTPESPLFSKEIFLPLLDTGLQNHALKVGDCPNLKYSEASCLVGGLLRHERHTVSIHSHDLLVHGDQHRGSIITYCSDITLHFLFAMVPRLVTSDPRAKATYSPKARVLKII